MRQFLRRLRAALIRWWVQPAAPPEKIGKVKAEQHRPVPIELGFNLHADGTVYQRQRDGSGDLRVRERAVIELVHAEYNKLVRIARRRQRARAWLRTVRPKHLTKN